MPQERRISHPVLLRPFPPFPRVGQGVGLDPAKQKKSRVKPIWQKASCGSKGQKMWVRNFPQKL